MALPEFSIEEHMMRHLFLYCRLLLIMGSWFMLQSQPVVFLGFIGCSLAIGVLDKLFYKIQPRP